MMITGSFLRTQDVRHLRKLFPLQHQGERQQPPQSEDQFMQSSSSQLQLPSKLLLHKLKSMGHLVRGASGEMLDVVENHDISTEKKNIT